MAQRPIQNLPNTSVQFKHWNTVTSLEQGLRTAPSQFQCARGPLSAQHRHSASRLVVSSRCLPPNKPLAEDLLCRNGVDFLSAHVKCVPNPCRINVEYCRLSINSMPNVSSACRICIELHRLGSKPCRISVEFVGCQKKQLVTWGLRPWICTNIGPAAVSRRGRPWYATPGPRPHIA